MMRLEDVSINYKKGINMNKFTRTLAAVALLASVASVNAQESVEKDSVNVKEERPEAPKKPDFKPSIPKVSGLINLRYGYDSGSETNSFDIRRTRLAVSGEIGPKIDYKFQAEFGGGSTTSAAYGKLIDAFVRFKFAKEFNAQVGQFKVEYSQETLDGPASWVTIENPQAVAKLNGYNDESGLKANSRDVGIRFYGGFGHKEGFDIVSYKIGLYNGNGINLKDNDKKKDFAGLLYINPIKELTITYGQYLGHYTKAITSDSLVTIDRNRRSAGLTFKKNDLFFRSEYLGGKTDKTEHQGFYATFAYTFKHGIQPLVSYSYYQKNRDTKVDNQNDFQIGLNWKANKWIRTQVAYTYTKYTDSNKDSKNLIEAQLIATY